MGGCGRIRDEEWNIKEKNELRKVFGLRKLVKDEESGKDASS